MRTRLCGTGGRTVSDTVSLRSFHVALSLAIVGPVANEVVTWNVAADEPDGIVTVGGTVATAWSLDSATVTGDDAGPDSVTLPVAVLPPAMLVGVT